MLAWMMVEPGRAAWVPQMLYSGPSVASHFTQVVPSRITDLPSAAPLFGLSREELTARLVEAGEPAWRGQQLADAIDRARVQSVGEITHFSNELRERLDARCWLVGR